MGRSRVSIHAPARGATQLAPVARPQLRCFNPRAREGRDRDNRLVIAGRRGFNPRAREGRDLRRVDAHERRREFQSTRPRGARPDVSSYSPRSSCFNPRAREGRDYSKKYIGTHGSSFNPRAREGRDNAARPKKSATAVSIHAPARGATAQQLFRVLTRDISIHAPARGATPDEVLRILGEPTFQSTRPRGARRTEDERKAIFTGFNPRAREGRDDFT